MTTTSMDDHGNSAEDASQIELGVPMSGELEGVGDVGLEKVGDVDFFAIQLPEGDFVFETELPDLRGYTEITVYDSNGGQVGLASSLSYDYEDYEYLVWESTLISVTTAGVYYMEVGGVWRSGLESINYIAVVVPARERDDHGNSPQDATVISVQSLPTQGSIDWVGDVDFFQVNLTAGNTYKFQVAQSNYRLALMEVEEDEEEDVDEDYFFRDSVLTMTLYNSSGTELFFADYPWVINDVPYAMRRYQYSPTDGVYYWKVAAQEGEKNSYSLKVELVIDDHGNTMESATSMVEGETVTGTINYPMDVDFFSIDLKAGSYTFIPAITGRLDGTVSIAVFDSDGDELGWGYDGQYYWYDWHEPVHVVTDADGLFYAKMTGDVVPYSLEVAASP
eukprot:CAMPEP_0170653538 /NCGR_PEP_ID=MMETSP0224-20130122/47458_1 /TAXON_ID=285029 /ORGANISM="Togula jolla, Strain CCCM 725" /LENGTH=391 /DNA_ID=CAMNT_0010985411 /DNA_START=12 /DNA_END=1187 /DNA_ORIENTATION=+